MPSARIVVINAERLAERFRMQPEKIFEAAQAPIARATERVRNRAVEGIQNGPKTGRVYEKYQPRRSHQASAQGEYPASDTGTLAGSIYSELNFDESFTPAEAGQLEGAVIADAEYAAPLEYKDPSDGGRPFLGRALQEDGDEFFDDMERSLRGVVGPDDGGSPPPGPAPTPRSPPTPPPARSSDDGSNEGDDGFSADDLNRREADRLRGLPPPGDGDDGDDTP